MAFVHLHTHSSFSPMWGVPTLDALCQTVKQQGQDFLALTDTNGLYGAIRFLEVAREHGLKPIIGAELVSGQHRAVLLAKNVTGYGNLCRILSARHCDASFEFIETVARHRTGLVLLSDDPVAVTAWQAESAKDIYIELTPGLTLQDTLAVSRRLRLPPVTTTRAAFLHPIDYQAHRLLRAIADNTTLSRLRADHCALPSHWLMPEPVLVRHLPHVPEAIANTRQIAKQCHTDWDFKQTIFPSFRQLSSDDAFETLQRKTYDGAIWRYGTLSVIVRQRIEKELRVIRERAMPSIFSWWMKLFAKRHGPVVEGPPQRQSSPTVSASHTLIRSNTIFYLNGSSIPVVTIRRISTLTSRGMSDRRSSNGSSRTMDINTPRWWRIRTHWPHARPCGRSRRSMACRLLRSARP